MLKIKLLLQKKLPKSLCARGLSSYLLNTLPIKNFWLRALITGSIVRYAILKSAVSIQLVSVVCELDVE